CLDLKQRINTSEKLRDFISVHEGALAAILALGHLNKQSSDTCRAPDPQLSHIHRHAVDLAKFVVSEGYYRTCCRLEALKFRCGGWWRTSRSRRRLGLRNTSSK